MSIDKRLTREYILQLEAGRELDAVVAERVMGWEWIIPKPTKNWISIPYAWDREKNEPHHDWYPSTDISAAWEVIGMIQKIGLSWSIKMPTVHPHEAFVTIGNKVVVETNIPCGICKAALLAVIET